MSRAPLLSVPQDVLDRIALQTVYQPAISHGFAFRLRTLSSLLVLCRNVYSSLSSTNNPYLYGEIFRILFDVAAVQRRLGVNAVCSAILTQELQRRLSMLKKLRTYLNQLDHRHQASPTVSDLVLLLFMLTENDGKNSQQLRYMFGLSGVANLCSALLSSSTNIYKSGTSEELETAVIKKSLAMIILWINPEEIIEYESAEKTNTILDILEPLAIQLNVHNPTSVVNFIYFGLSGSLVLSPLAYTRLCVVERYDIIKRRLVSPHRQSDPHSASQSHSLASGDMDLDFCRFIRIHRDTSGLGQGSSHSTIPIIRRPVYPARAERAHADFETEWNGGWFVPSLMGSSVYTVYQPMRFRIRAYTPASSDDVVHFVKDENDEDEEGEGLSKAWFHEGVEFSERIDSLRIFDPMLGRTSYYQPKSSDRRTDIAVADTILCGETTAAHGVVFGDFIFHGRLRGSDGKIALIRRPTNPDMDDLGVWIFHGHLYGRYNFVGDWWNTSTAKDTPGGSGWFRFIGNTR